jgi:exosortase D (VPLPA-CTERM-specific)
MSITSVRASAAVESRTAVMAAVAMLLALGGFGRALLELVRRWQVQEEYSHGFLIPVVVAMLLWARRDALRTSVGRPSFAGLALVLLAIAMHVVGELSAIYILSQVGFVVALIGIVLAMGGFSLLRVALLPIVYLLFAIPLPYFIDALLTLRLQLISSELGVLFIRLFQIPVYLDGNVIDMGVYKLQVVEACSGLRYLYPLLSLSFLAAYLFQAPLWQRAVVFLSSIPIAIGMNGFRIGVVGLLVDHWGTQMAEGVLHFFEGWVIFLACSALLAGEMYALARVSGKRFFEVFHVPNIRATSNEGAVTKSMRNIPLVACLCLLCAGGLGMFFISGRSEIIPERTRFVAFPARLEEWQGHISSLEPAIERGLGFDDYILSDYSLPGGKPVNLYIAYYASQRKGESPHSPIVCIPGGGWQIAALERRNYSDGGVDFPLNRVIISKGSTRQLVYYWFDERGRAVADEYLAKWYLLTDAIFRNRTDGALIRLVTEISPNETDSDADRRLRTFMQVAISSLGGFLPSGAGSQLSSMFSRPLGSHS